MLFSSMIARVRVRSVQDRRQLWQEVHGPVERCPDGLEIDDWPSFILIETRPVEIWDTRYFGNCPGPIWPVAEKTLKEIGLDGQRYVCAHDVEID